MIRMMLSSLALAALVATATPAGAESMSLNFSKIDIKMPPRAAKPKKARRPANAHRRQKAQR